MERRGGDVGQGYGVWGMERWCAVMVGDGRKTEEWAGVIRGC